MAILSFHRLYTISIALGFDCATGTSSKMDFLPLAHVRTDPILEPTCLSDHVHTFYGANVSLRPGTSFTEMRAARGNTGNVEENNSLYWHPSIYKLDNVTGTYTLVKPWFATAYYIWTTGSTEAFPDGFAMITKQMTSNKSRWKFECNGPSNGIPFHTCPHCNMSSVSWNFPETGCNELELRIAFPTCWNGNVTSPDGMSHVAFDLEEGGSFDGRCPPEYPRKLPEIQLYIRIKDYEGGYHVFADGTDMLHADYMSGWNQTELKTVLDTCNNSGLAAMPDQWCENQLTFRDAPKTYDPNINNDPLIEKKLLALQPPALDTRSTISFESVDKIQVLPRGGCTGTLIPAPATSTPTSSLCSSCTNGCLHGVTCYTVHPLTQQNVTQQMCNQYNGTLWCGPSSLMESPLASKEGREKRKGEWPVKAMSSTPKWTRKPIKNKGKGFLEAARAESGSDVSPFLQTDVHVAAQDLSESNLNSLQREVTTIEKNHWTSQEL